MDYALKELDKNTISKIFIYIDVKKFNKTNYNYSRFEEG